MNLLDAWKALTDAAAARAWYPLVAVVLWLLLQVAKNRTPEQWHLKNGWKWVVPFVTGAVAGFVDGWQSGLPLKGSLLRSGYAVFALALPAMGWQSGLKDSPLGGVGTSLFGKETKIETKVEPVETKPEEKKTTIPPVLPLSLLALSLLFLPAATCAQAKVIARTANDRAAEICAAYYSTKKGISVDDALKAFCTGEQVLAPWIHLVLSAEKNGVGKSGVALCEQPATQSVVDGGRD